MDGSSCDESSGPMSDTAARRAAIVWWTGYAILIGVAIIAVAVITANPVAAFIAGGCVVLSATWTAGRYSRGR